MRTDGSRRPGLRGRALLIITTVVAGVLAAVGVGIAAVADVGPFGNAEVGQTTAQGTLLPSNQWVTPLGTRILDNNARLVSSSISPDGKYLAALGWNNFSGYLTIVNLQTQKIVEQQALVTGPSGNQDYSVAADGPLWSPDGSTLWVPQSAYLDRFSFDESTGQASETATILLCGQPATASACTFGPSNAQGAYLPSGMALSPDGSSLYVALNGANALGVIDTATNTLSTMIPVGNAPRQVVLTDGGQDAYVSNEGGRPAQAGQFTNLSDGTPIVSNKSTGAASTGTVSVVDLGAGSETKEIKVGLQPTAMYLDGNALMVANSNDDSLSVINTNSNVVTQTVSTNPVPGAKVGSYADSISMPDAGHVLVSIGRDNAIAEYSWNGLKTKMTYDGLMGTDWYPVNAQPDPALGAGTIVVTNDKGIGARGPQSTIYKGPYTKNATGYNTYDDTGSVTLFTLPTSSSDLANDTKQVFTDNAWDQIGPIDSGADDTVPSVIPAQLGEKSPIKHIVVIVKENRTYDQVLGDLGEGNGDPADAQFGQAVTPNFHALAQRFGDLDNFYDEGTLSADGHNWIVQAEANDYLEKEFGAFYRSYPSQGGDALAYQRDGFLWNAAEKAGKSVQDYGEYAYNPYSQPPPSWDKWYTDSQILEGKQKGTLPVPTCKYKTSSDIPSLNKILDPCFPNFQLNIPDQFRVDMWNQEFQQQEKSGDMPNLTFMWLMSDHTAGVGTGDPDPVAEVADNDLAVGRVVDEISHSKFWKSTAIFVDEDDTQNGVDHVDGHRDPVFVVSPYSAGGVQDQYDSQVNMVRTIEQILGVKPMNQEDGAAEPMYSAFTATPNEAPYNALANEIPLTLGAPGYPSTITSGPLKGTGAVPSSMRKVYRAWVRWSRSPRRRFNGIGARQDVSNPAQLDRLDWYSAHNWTVAYPGDKRIDLPDQVPGRNLPNAFIGN
jgi:YVTN family beta-propeller protein